MKNSESFKESIYSKEPKKIGIFSYINLFEEILKQRESIHPISIQNFKDKLYERFVIKRTHENFARYFQRKGELDQENNIYKIYSGKEKVQMMQRVIDAQKQSLDLWIDYLLSKDCSYSIKLKMFILKNILQMGGYNPETKTYFRRMDRTYKPFADLNEEALGKVINAIENKEHLVDPDLEWIKLAKKGKFPNMYGYALNQIYKQKQEQESSSEGKWEIYKQGSDFKKLMKDTDGKGSGWCFATNTYWAKKYTEESDLNIYYTKDKNGNYSIPRILVVTKNRNLNEVRGTDKNFNMEDIMTSIADKKMQEFSNYEDYKTKSSDMKKLTVLYKRCFAVDNKTGKKSYLNPQLTRDELIFIYEINSKIQGFGMDSDPRISQIRNKRNYKEDICFIFKHEQIANTFEQINENTKIYVGEWNVWAFQKIRQYNIEKVYRHFPDKKIFMKSVSTDPNIDSFESIKTALDKKNTPLGLSIEYFIKNIDFTKEIQTQKLVEFTVSELGFSNEATTEEIYKKAKDFGLELCSPVIAINQILQYSEQGRMLIDINQLLNKQKCSRLIDFYIISYQLTYRDYVSFDIEEVYSTKKWLPSTKFIFQISDKETIEPKVNIDSIIEEARDTADMKLYSLAYFLKNFGIDLRDYPEYWEQIYDLFKKANNNQMDLGELISNHLINGEPINDLETMNILTRTDKLLRLISPRGGSGH